MIDIVYPKEFEDIYPTGTRWDDFGLSKDRMFMLWQWARATANIPGDSVEVGVYRGRSSALIARTARHRKHHAFDTFTGIPPILHEKDKASDMIKVGDFNDIGDALDILEAEPNIVIHSGVFPGTAVSLQRKTFSFAHFDGDIYNTLIEFLRFFYPRMHPGGVMVFDDYGWEKTPGVATALEEFFVGKAELVQTTKYQVILVKHAT